MEKDRSSRVVSIIALLIAIVGLSIGFAAYTRGLNITFSETKVSINSDLDIKISVSEDINDNSTTINPMLEGAPSANQAIIADDRLTISNIGATFSNKDQGVLYYFYIYNNSEYDAYLKKVDFLNYKDETTNKVCTALPGTTQSLVDTTCKDLHILFGVANETEELIFTDNSQYTSFKISKGNMIMGVAGIAYDGENDDFSVPGYEGTSDSLLPNGDFKINFGAIRLTFSTIA